MTLADLLAGTRAILDDVVAPLQWSDADLTRYLNEGQDQFARRTFCFLDSESAFTRVSTVADTNRYALDPLVLTVLAVEDETGRALRGVFTSRVTTPSTGKPTMFTARTNTRSLILWPVPDDAYDLQLLVARRPLDPLASATDEAEIPEEFQPMLYDFAAYKALKMVDPDNENLKASTRLQAEWEMQMRDAKREFYRFATMDSIPSVLRRGW